MSDRHNPILAYEIRYEHGWKLNETLEWTHPRIKKIAIKQKKLFEEIDKLDDEILSIARKYAKENGITLGIDQKREETD
jgi:hypothetical protein